MHRLAALAGAIALACCNPNQLARRPRAAEATRIMQLFVVILIVSAVVWGGVLLALAGGLWRRNDRRSSVGEFAFEQIVFPGVAIYAAVQIGIWRRLGELGVRQGPLLAQPTPSAEVRFLAYRARS